MAETNSVWVPDKVPDNFPEWLKKGAEEAKERSKELDHMQFEMPGFDVNQIKPMLSLPDPVSPVIPGLLVTARESQNPADYHTNQLKTELGPFLATFVTTFPLISYVRKTIMVRQEFCPPEDTDVLFSLARGMVEVYPEDNVFGEAIAPYRRILKNWIIADPYHHRMMVEAAHLVYQYLKRRGGNANRADYKFSEQQYKDADKAARTIFELFMHEMVAASPHLLSLSSDNATSQMTWEQEYYIPLINDTWEWIRNNDESAVEQVMEHEEIGKLIYVFPMINPQTLAEGGIDVEHFAQQGMLGEYINAADIPPLSQRNNQLLETYEVYGYQVTMLPKSVFTPQQQRELQIQSATAPQGTRGILPQAVIQPQEYYPILNQPEPAMYATPQATLPAMQHYHQPQQGMMNFIGTKSNFGEEKFAHVIMPESWINDQYNKVRGSIEHHRQANYQKNPQEADRQAAEDLYWLDMTVKTVHSQQSKPVNMRYALGWFSPEVWSEYLQSQGQTQAGPLSSIYGNYTNPMLREYTIPASITCFLDISNTEAEGRYRTNGTNLTGLAPGRGIYCDLLGTQFNQWISEQDPRRSDTRHVQIRLNNGDLLTAVNTHPFMRAMRDAANWCNTYMRVHGIAQINPNRQNVQAPTPTPFIASPPPPPVFQEPAMNPNQHFQQNHHAAPQAAQHGFTPPSAQNHVNHQSGYGVPGQRATPQVMQPQVPPLAQPTPQHQHHQSAYGQPQPMMAQQPQQQVISSAVLFDQARRQFSASDPSHVAYLRQITSAGQPVFVVGPDQQLYPVTVVRHHTEGYVGSERFLVTMVQSAVQQPYGYGNPQPSPMYNPQQPPFQQQGGYMQPKMEEVSLSNSSKHSWQPEGSYKPGPHHPRYDEMSEKTQDVLDRTVPMNQVRFGFQMIIPKKAVEAQIKKMREESEAAQKVQLFSTPTAPADNRVGAPAQPVAQAKAQGDFMQWMNKTADALKLDKDKGGLNIEGPKPAPTPPPITPAPRPVMAESPAQPKPPQPQEVRTKPVTSIKVTVGPRVVKNYAESIESFSASAPSDIAANPMDNVQVIEFNPDGTASKVYLEPLSKTDKQILRDSIIDYSEVRRHELVTYLCNIDHEAELVPIQGTPHKEYVQLAQEEPEEGFDSLPFDQEPETLAVPVFTSTVLSQQEAWMQVDTDLYTAGRYHIADEVVDEDDIEAGLGRHVEAVMVAKYIATPIVDSGMCADYLQSLNKFKIFEQVVNRLNKDYASIVRKNKDGMSVKQIWDLKTVSFIDNLFTKEVNRVLKKEFGMDMTIESFSQEADTIEGMLAECHGWQFSNAFVDLQERIISEITNCNPDADGNAAIAECYADEKLMGVVGEDRPSITFVTRPSIFIGLRITYNNLNICLSRNGVARALVKDPESGMVGGEVMNSIINQIDSFLEGQKEMFYENILVRTLDGRIINLATNPVSGAWMASLES